MQREPQSWRESFFSLMQLSVQCGPSRCEALTMKPILVYSFASMLLLASGPAGAGDDPFDLADKVIREHQLLTPKQIECMTLIERDDTTAEIAKVGVYERHDEECGGDPEITHRLFDLEIDRKTGAAKWDNNLPDMEMRPVPSPAPAAQAETMLVSPPMEPASPGQVTSAVEQVADESCHVPGGAERGEVLNAMRRAVERDLRQPVLFKVSTIRVCGEWAFVVAEPLKPSGGEIKWQSTICKGDVSHLVGALSQKDQSGAWRLKDYALCPTDVAWENWPEKYGAPQAVFAE
jgi:hypothetical protein